VTGVRRIGGGRTADESGAWAHRQVRAAAAVVETYATRLSEQARPELAGARAQLDRRDAPARRWGIDGTEAGCVL
jgi:hypothetical protein